MRLTETVEKLKRLHLLLRIWFWAAMRSRHFHDCQLYLIRRPIRTQVYLTGDSPKVLFIQITLHVPELALTIPYRVYAAFAKETQTPIENITESLKTCIIQLV